MRLSGFSAKKLNTFRKMLKHSFNYLIKKSDNVKITKLKDVADLETNFNRMDKAVFNIRALLSQETNQAILCSIITNRRRRQSLHAALIAC